MLLNLKRAIALIAISVSVLLTSMAHAGSVDNYVNDNQVALSGYDPVAYFVKNKPRKGNQKYTAVHNGVIYRFESADNRDTFNTNPNRYAPQYGGFCAFGAAMGKKFDGDPKAWKIVDDKLYINLNSRVQTRWVKDIPGYIGLGNSNWEEIQSVPASEL